MVWIGCARSALGLVQKSTTARGKCCAGAVTTTGATVGNISPVRWHAEHSTRPARSSARAATVAGLHGRTSAVSA